MSNDEWDEIQKQDRKTLNTIAGLGLLSLIACFVFPYFWWNGGRSIGAFVTICLVGTAIGMWYDEQPSDPNRRR